jgi:hypothetical protein
MLTRETFTRLVEVVRRKGESEDKTVRGRQFRVVTISEFTVIFERLEKGWRTDGITFELFSAEFFITPDGSISITNDEERDELYSVSDRTLVSVVGSFLNWRLGVLEKISI